MKKDINFKIVIMYAGAIIAFLIGSGFATGQEVLQYFSAYGYFGVLGSLLTLILLAYVCSSFLIVGYQKKFEKGNDIYKYYCGDKLGMCFDYFSTLFCFLSFIVMVAGASATLKEHYNIGEIYGGGLIVILAFITVIGGLSKIAEIVGKIGPAIVVIAISVGFITIIKNFSNLNPVILTSALQELESYNRLVKASSTWYIAVFSYVGFCMLWLAGFLSSLGAKLQNEKEAVLSGVLGAVLFSLAVMVVCLGLLSSISLIAGTQIPMLYLANDIYPIFSTIFTFIILAGIYSTAVPLLWNVVSRFTKEKTNYFKILTMVLSVIALVVGIGLPFDRLVNIVYVINGYFGGGLLIIMLYRTATKNKSRKLN